MASEIERKFLVLSDEYKRQATKHYFIKQGFLNSDKNRVVRIRITDEHAYITVKGLTDKTGTTRFEWEKEIELTDAQNLLKLCEPGIISKYRYEVNLDNNCSIEVDEFLDENTGLVVAEIELKSADSNFKKPDWLGIEVTGIKNYYNAALSKNPYKNWKNKKTP